MTSWVFCTTGQSMLVPGTRSQPTTSLWTNYSAAPRVGYSGDVMFAQLTAYHWLSMAQSYPYFYYSTVEGGEFPVKIFACFYTELAFQYNVAEGEFHAALRTGSYQTLGCLWLGSEVTVTGPMLSPGRSRRPITTNRWLLVWP